MSGICGWFGQVPGVPASVLEAMRAHITWAGAPGSASAVGEDYALAASGPPEAVTVLETPALAMAFHGHALWLDTPRLPLSPRDACARFAEAYRAHGADALARLGGDFALALVDRARQRLLLAIDRMGMRTLVYRQDPAALVFAATADALRPALATPLAPDTQATYDYVYFHMVPGPRTAYRDVLRVLPGHQVVADAQGVATRAYWQPHFHEREHGDRDTQAATFRSLLEEGVRELALPGTTGTFLSGGTDSSTVTGMLAKTGGGAPPSFSIGFDATGYDEMEYARIAARHFASAHRAYYVTPQDVVTAIPMIAQEYDQPFGNSSAIPAYYCARLARDNGIARMLAGDGGDELFGGNSRYARQHQFALYERMPALARAGLEPLLGMPGIARIPLLRKAASYVRQAKLPMPERYESYNLLAHFGPASVFDADYLAAIDTAHPMALLREHYRSVDASSLINRLLGLDFKFTLADNDLPKVTRMCDRAGVDVAFPMLHDALVEFSTRLAPDLKLRGTKLRYFFKESLRGFLPPQIIAKQKHGFGLPAGPWLASHAPLRELSRDALASLKRRGMFRRQFIDGLLDARLAEHAGYYGTMVWVLMMLELWFEHHVDRVHRS